MTFDEAFERLIGHEGGYVNHPNDPGGETRFGISKRSYPNEDIKAMTVARAKEIYRRDFWYPAGCDDVADAARFDLFDTAVNSGVKRAVRLLQRAAGTGDDGVLGPQTLLALRNMDGPRFVARFNGHRMLFIASQPDIWWDAFGKGLMNRIAANLTQA